MMVPDKVMINGIQYEVCISEDKHELLEMRYSGRIDYHAQKIAIKQGGPEAMKVSLLHECMHGMLNALGVQGDKHDEHLVQGLANQIYLLIKDNPEMLRDGPQDDGEQISVG